MATKYFEILEDFGLEREKQHKIYDVTGRLIKKIIKELVPQIQELGMPSDICLSIAGSMAIEDAKNESLKTMLSRKKMKVSMFGATSSGKSMVINAMLGRELMACGIAHTTSCFVQIEQLGDDSNPDARFENVTESYFVVRQNQSGQEERFPLGEELLYDFCDAMSDHALDESHKLEVYLSQVDHLCPLLRNPLQILDCPGIGTCEQIGDRVKAFCGDSDVHVLIVDGISGMTIEEKQHFMNVKERLPNPDIIIGFTQWDRAANERPERKARVEKRHRDTAYELMRATGTVTNRDDADARCFFFSGQEALYNAKREPMKSATGQMERLQSFHDFLTMIEVRASHNAKKNKLEESRQLSLQILTTVESALNTPTSWIRDNEGETERECQRLVQVLDKIALQQSEFVAHSMQLRDSAIDMGYKDLEMFMNAIKQGIEDRCRRTSLDEFEKSEHEFGVRAIHDWFFQVVRGQRRAVQESCEEYSMKVHGKYQELFPHEHPPNFYQALIENNMSELSQSSIMLGDQAVSTVVKQFTDRGLVAISAATRRHFSDIEGDETRTAVSRRAAAAVGVVMLQIRRWVKSSVETHVLDRVGSKMNRPDLEMIKNSCKQSIATFCDNTDEYYKLHVERALELRVNELKTRRTKINCLRQFKHKLQEYRKEIGIIKQKL